MSESKGKSAHPQPNRQGLLKAQDAAEFQMGLSPDPEQRLRVPSPPPPGT